MEKSTGVTNSRRSNHARPKIGHGRIGAMDPIRPMRSKMMARMVKKVDKRERLKSKGL